MNRADLESLAADAHHVALAQYQYDIGYAAIFGQGYLRALTDVSDLRQMNNPDGPAALKDKIATLESEIASLQGVLVQLRGKTLAYAPDGWYAVIPMTQGHGLWVKFSPDDQKVIERAYEGYRNEPV